MILESLRRILISIEEYVVKIELHEDGGLHAHCFLKRSHPFQIHSKNKLDIDLKKIINCPSCLDIINDRKDKGVILGNYVAAKSEKSVVSYILKDVDIGDSTQLDELVSSYKTYEEIFKFLQRLFTTW